MNMFAKYFVLKNTFFNKCGLQNLAEMIEPSILGWTWNKNSVIVLVKKEEEKITIKLCQKKLKLNNLEKHQKVEVTTQTISQSHTHFFQGLLYLSYLSLLHL